MYVSSCYLVDIYSTRWHMINVLLKTVHTIHQSLYRAFYQ